MRIYVDTNMVIRAMEHTDAAADAVARIFSAATTATLSLVTSEITLSEVLVGPFKSQDVHLAEAYERLLCDQEIFELVPVTREILTMAARVRARRVMELPDAVHAATATSTACGHMLTFDQQFEGSGDFLVLGPSDPRFASLRDGDQ